MSRCTRAKYNPHTDSPITHEPPSRSLGKLQDGYHNRFTCPACTAGEELKPVTLTGGWGRGSVHTPLPANASRNSSSAVTPAAAAMRASASPPPAPPPLPPPPPLPSGNPAVLSTGSVTQTPTDHSPSHLGGGAYSSRKDADASEAVLTAATQTATVDDGESRNIIFTNSDVDPTVNASTASGPPGLNSVTIARGAASVNGLASPSRIDTTADRIVVWMTSDRASGREGKGRGTFHVKVSVAAPNPAAAMRAASAAVVREASAEVGVMLSASGNSDAVARATGADACGTVGDGVIGVKEGGVGNDICMRDRDTGEVISTGKTSKQSKKGRAEILAVDEDPAPQTEPGFWCPPFKVSLSLVLAVATPTRVFFLWGFAK